MIPQWNKSTAGLEPWRERVRLYIMGTKAEDRHLCGPRLLATLDPESDEYKTICKQITDEQLCEATGKGALLVVDKVRACLGPKSVQEAVKLTKEFISLSHVRRNQSEGMRHFTTRFHGHYVKVGQALKETCDDIDPEKFLHPLVRGILLMEASGLDIHEQNSVLATSGKAQKAGQAFGNSWLYEDLVDSLTRQWSDEAITKRDKHRKKDRATAHAMETQAAEIAGIRDDLLYMKYEQDELVAGMQDFEIIDAEEDYEEHGAEGNEDYPTAEQEECDELVAAVNVVEQFGGDVDEAEAFAAESAANAARTFQEARRLLQEVKTSRNYWPVVGLAVAPDAQSSFGKGKGGDGKGRSMGAGRGGKGKGGKGGWPRDAPPRSPAGQPAKRSMTSDGKAGKGGRWHGPRSAAGPVCILCRQPGHIARDCPNRGDGGTQQARKRALGSYAGTGYTTAQLLATTATVIDPEVLDCDFPKEINLVAAVETEEFVAFDTESTRGVGIWDCGASMSAGSAELLQELHDDACEKYGEVKLNEARVRFTFAGGEQSDASSQMFLPVDQLDGGLLKLHPVPNPNTPILLGLDNLRSLKMVLDFDEDTAFSKTLGKFLPTVRLAGGHLGLDLSSRE